MLIQLTQQEIKEAIHQYVVSEDGLGINLKGKVLTTNFTATRGEQGVIANLSIDKIGATQDVEIPGFTNAPEEVIAAANTTPAPAAISQASVPTEAKGKGKRITTADQGMPAPVTIATLAETPVLADAPIEEAKTEPAAAAEQEDAAVAGSVEEAAEVVVPKTATTSLFG